jgi:hypothetical protein
VSFHGASEGSPGEGSPLNAGSWPERPLEGLGTKDQHKNISIIHACSGFDFQRFSGLGVRGVSARGFNWMVPG